ncbi:MAG: hypothetical protein J5917_03585 [Bacteroidales bacterium]|nr:hypothetical protein [Bacteroidales bacterium]
MKKAFLHMMVLASVAIVMGACQKGPVSQDPDPQEQAQKEEKVIQFWDVVGQLVAASDITDDYQGKTFEPVIGVADASDPQARIVPTNSAAAAARSFANLVGVDSIDENTPSYTWSNPEVGTLTYTKMSGTAWAEVKVDIPSVPHLSKLIYRSAEQGDTNASFKGSAYYRFGDVISRLNSDNETEYWVCVRPAFSPEGKGETHWMSIGHLPKENVWKYTSSHKKEYYLPTKLKSSKEHMQNLAEMLYAICYPDTWSQNITNYSTIGTFGSPGGLPMFHDFHMTNLKYHNADFWTNVASGWRKMGIAEKLFGVRLEGIAEEINTDGLHFLYKGYSWNTWTSNYATLYQARFVNTSNSVNANMQTKEPYSDVKAQVVYDDPNKDVVLDVTKQPKYFIESQFFGNAHPRFILRYATGAELSKTGKYSDVHVAIPGTEDVYRYYRDVLPVTDLANHEPEVTTAKIVNNRKLHDLSSFTGPAHYRLGNVYKDEKDHLWFVVNMAGNGGITDIPKENAPFSELVSFEGIERVDRQMRYLWNLPLYEEAVRAIALLHNLYMNAVPEVYNAGQAENELKPASVVVRFLQEQARIDITRLFQSVEAHTGDGRSSTQMTGFAYMDELPNPPGQAVGRYVFPVALGNEKLPCYFWQHYPAEPSAKALTYQSYSQDLIYLQDVADEQKVQKYGPDYFAAGKLTLFDPKYSLQLGGERTFRKAADPTAQTLELYFYDYNSWNAYQYRTDMWNEPLLMFQADAVYDRGDEYSTETVHHQHNLTLVAEFPLLHQNVGSSEDARKEAEEGYLMTLYSYKALLFEVLHGQNVYLDGGQYAVPDWQAVWRKQYYQR